MPGRTAAARQKLSFPPPGITSVFAGPVRVSTDDRLHRDSHRPAQAGRARPEAETTQRALERLGFELEDLRSADQFELDLDAADAGAARERAEEMTERLLANPTIHDYEVTVDER